MTDEQINAAIAKACGFVCLHEFQVEKDGAKFGFWEYPPTWTGPKKQPWCLDFCADLNAMHEAEKSLKGYKQIHTYVWLLKNRNNWDTDFKLMEVHISARERAEALLKVLGKWEEVQG